MKTQVFRLVVVAGLMAAAAACAQSAAQPPTAPSAAAAGTAAATAPDGSTLKATAPALISPVDGVTIDSRQPTVVWANSAGTFEELGFAYELEISDVGSVLYTRVVGETANVGQHKADIILDEDKVFYWRIRSRIGDAVGPWSGYGEFRTPRPKVVVAPTPTPGTPGTSYRTPDPPAGQRLPRRNDLGTLLALSASDPSLLRESCQEHGGNWRFMDAGVDALRAIDMRWGYNCKRGNCNDTSVDVFSYHWGAGPDEGSSQVYCVDVISGHCGGSPSLFWNDVTNITFDNGTVCRVTYQRPGRKTYLYGPS